MHFCHLKLEIAAAIPASNDLNQQANNSEGQELTRLERRRIF